MPTIELTIQNLEKKRAALIERGAALSEERKAIAFDAHVGTDKNARSRLDKLHAEFATFESELQSLDDALTTANKKLEAALRLEATAADRAQALRAREAFAQFVAAGLALDDALAAVTKHAATMKSALNEAHTLGCSTPSNAQFSTLGELAIQSALMATPWSRGFRHLAPRERHSFAALVRGWARSATPAIEARLGEQQDEEAA